MAHKKGQGSTRNGRDSHSQRLGVKATGGEFVTTGSIIIRQRGTKWVPYIPKNRSYLRICSSETIDSIRREAVLVLC